MKRVLSFLAVIVYVVHGWEHDDLAKQVDELNAKLLEVQTHSDVKSLTQQVTAMNRRLSAHDNTGRRKLWSNTDIKDYIGLKLTKEKSIVSFGSNKDVNMFRSGPGVLNVWAQNFNIGGATDVAKTLNAKAITAKSKFTFRMGNQMCTMELKAGMISTSCAVDSKTTRMLSTTITNLKTCDQAAMVSKLDAIIKQTNQDAIMAKLDLILKYTKIVLKPKSCADVKKNNPSAASGMYTLTAPAGGTIKVMCEMKKNGGGWTRFLQLNGATKGGCTNFKDVPLNREIVGAYCQNKEFTFSRSMMLASKHELMYTDDQARIMWYRFTECNANQCTCDKASDKGRCFFLAVTADYSGGRPLYNNAAEDYDIWTEAYDWGEKRFENQGDGQCGGNNANAHTQFNCAPSKQKGKGQCGQRWHYGSRHDGSHKGGSTCGGGGAGCAWNWYTGLATAWAGCNPDTSKWMIQGPKANGQKRTAEVWFR